MKYMPQGTVYGTLLNFRAEFQALAPKMHEPPYQAPPKAPVLYIKPANTWSADGADIPVPARVSQVEVGATVAMVMSGPVHIGGYILMNDLSLPHASFFRPPVRFKCLDGFLGVGSKLVDAVAAGDPSRFRLEVRINGAVRQTVDFGSLVRNAQKLLGDVSEFMTLGAGDALMLGCDLGRPLAQAGDRIEITGAGLGALVNRLVAEAG